MGWTVVPLFERLSFCRVAPVYCVYAFVGKLCACTVAGQFLGHAVIS